MPGRLFLNRTPEEVEKLLGASMDLPNGLWGDDIAPGQEVLVLAPEPCAMRWGILPVGRVNARGRPVMETLVNVRSETMAQKSAFEGFGYCVVLADGWFEWTGRKGRKDRWRLRPKDHGLIGFAALCDRWESPGGQTVWQVATVTCEPNAEVEAIHHRMGVLLRPDQFDVWINGSDADRRALARPSKDGTIEITKA